MRPFNHYELRIGNWVMNSHGTLMQMTLDEFQFMYDESDPAHHPKPVPLTTDWLLDFDWPCDRKASKKTDTDGLWIKNGITIYQGGWDQDQFNYATYVRGDGEFKGGFSIQFVHQLQNLYTALSGQELVRCIHAKQWFQHTSVEKETEEDED